MPLLYPLFRKMQKPLKSVIYLKAVCRHFNIRGIFIWAMFTVYYIHNKDIS